MHFRPRNDPKQKRSTSLNRPIEERWNEHVRCIEGNTTSTDLTGYPLFVILDVLGSLYFAPGFTKELDAYLELYPYFALGETHIDILSEFLWPEDVGAASGIIWYAAILDPGFTAIVGDWASWEFS